MTFSANADKKRKEDCFMKASKSTCNEEVLYALSEMYRELGDQLVNGDVDVGDVAEELTREIVSNTRKLFHDFVLATAYRLVWETRNDSKVYTYYPRLNVLKTTCLCTDRLEEALDEWE